jgi:hypothetical protein
MPAEIQSSISGVHVDAEKIQKLGVSMSVDVRGRGSLHYSKGYNAAPGQEYKDLTAAINKLLAAVTAAKDEFEQDVDKLKAKHTSKEENR